MVSTTVSVLPYPSHVNVSGVVQESFNASTFIHSGGNLQDHEISARYRSQPFQQPQVSQVTHRPLKHSYDFTASKVTESLHHIYSYHIPFTDQQLVDLLLSSVPFHKLST